MKETIPEHEHCVRLKVKFRPDINNRGRLTIIVARGEWQKRFRWGTWCPGQSVIPGLNAGQASGVWSWSALHNTLKVLHKKDLTHGPPCRLALPLKRDGSAEAEISLPPPPSSFSSVIASKYLFAYRSVATQFIHLENHIFPTLIHTCTEIMTFAILMTDRVRGLHNCLWSICFSITGAQLYISLR